MSAEPLRVLLVEDEPGHAELARRAFEGQASQLVAHLLDQSKPTSAELAEIRKAIEQYQEQRGG